MFCILYKKQNKCLGDERMITTLHIKNIGIIDDIYINLNEGFNVLTGETGAGKTLIIDSLGILAGNRFSKEMIRNGEDFSFVELCLYLPWHPCSIEGNIIVSREIFSNGRNLCKINGRMVTVNELKEFMHQIIDIHGQGDNQTLMDVSNHIKLLDAYSYKELESIKEKYETLFIQYQEIKKLLKENYGDEKEKQRKLDLLKYQAKEITEAKLDLEEEDILEIQKLKIINTNKIVQSLELASKQIDESAIDALSSAIKAMEKIEGLDENYTQALTRLKSVYYELQETGRDICNEYEKVSYEEMDIEEIETRLNLINSLKRKYGNTIEDIIKYRYQIEEEIRNIENLDEYILNLKQQQMALENDMRNLALQMHEIRKKEGKVISLKINQELKDLEMKQANFSIQVKWEEDKFQKNGMDSVEFLVSTNVGDEAKSLLKIASGGEMSRIMLAIKTVLADIDEVPILVFDEIDTGISGIAANSVAEKLKKIAKTHQVLCVTHLASIAAKGKYNYYIGKQIVKDTTKTEIRQLNEEETICEIARIASGVLSEAALNHARELRK